MPEPVNPLIPTTYDIVWSVGAGALLVLLVISLISIARAARSLTSTQALVWTLLAMLVPLLGPLAWLCIGRRSAGMPASARSERVTDAVR